MPFLMNKSLEGSGAEHGSGAGSIPDDDNDDDDDEGSGDYPIKVTRLSPKEIDTMRRAFYYEYEADLLRLDNSCETKFILAPQIFNAKIT